MSKKRTIAILSTIAILIIATLIYSFVAKSGQVPQSDQFSSTTVESSSLVSISTSRQSETSKGLVGNSQIVSDYTENEAATDLIKTFGSIGNEYTLHSRYYRQGEAKVEEASSLGWDGDLLLTVKLAQVQDYSAADDESGDPVRATWPTYVKAFSDPCVLKLDMTLTNKDAENKTGVRYLFNASMFRLAAYEDLIPDNWENAETYVSIGEQYSALEAQFDKHSDNDDYWSFTLEPEETLDFTLQFLIDRKYLEQNTPFLAVSFGRQIECGVLLDKIE